MSTDNSHPSSSKMPRGWHWTMLFVLLVPVAVYGLLVGRIFLYRHLPVPSGAYSKSLVGTYRVVNQTSLQIPEVFRGKMVSIVSVGPGRFVLVDEQQRQLSLQEGANGLYFDENFDPVGARILPGLARNWNEGRVIQSQDGAMVNGYMLEKGLMLFLVPFQDVALWTVELKRMAAADGE